MTNEQKIDREVLNIDPEQCCCPDWRKGIQALSDCLRSSDELYGGADPFRVPQFRLCPWCGAVL